jgi:DNA-binding transcriptional regulator YhcF (GntR family)
MDEKTLQRVKELRDNGLTIEQVAKELKVSRATVKRAVAKLKKVEKEAQQAIPEERLRAVIREEIELAKNSVHPGDGLPVVRKMGQGIEVTNPEAVLRSYLLQDGLPGEWMLKGAMVMRAAQLMVMDDVTIMKGEAEAHAKLMKPILHLLKETMSELDAAARRAKASTLEAAHEAPPPLWATDRLFVTSDFCSLARMPGT